MAQLIVRNLDEALIRHLKKKAGDSGHSMEAEHREILRKALLGSRDKMSLKQWLAAIPNAGKDSDFARVPGKPRKVRL
jgi:plasmid stability protein